MGMTEEQKRLRELQSGVEWQRWGPYLSERSWGTVREDYSVFFFLKIIYFFNDALSHLIFSFSSEYKQVQALTSRL